MIEALAAAAAVAISVQLFVGLAPGMNRLWSLRRDQKGRALVLAARLHSEMQKELDRLDDRNRHLRAHIRRSAGSPESAPIFGSDLLEGLHATMIEDLRQRAESAFEGLDLGQGHDLEDRCLSLAELTAEVGRIALEMREREEAWGFLPVRRRPSRTGVVIIPPLRQGSPA